jgi:hypothetical protein
MSCDACPSVHSYAGWSACGVPASSPVGMIRKMLRAGGRRVLSASHPASSPITRSPSAADPNGSFVTVGC